MKLLSDTDIIDLMRDSSIYGFFVHQVNCKKVAGRGLALAIRNAIPGWYKFYLDTPPKLGSISCFSLPGKNKSLVSIYAQNGYSGNVGQRSTDYTAFESCIIDIKELNKYLGRDIYFPHGIGSGLGGGSWEVIYGIIDKHLGEFATIVKKG